MIELQHEDQIPESAITPLRQLCELLKQTLPTLRGVILHGSAATSGFEPGRSDLDVFAIVDGRPDELALKQIGAGMLVISSRPHELEFSIVSTQALQRWKHPCPHLFHFGEHNRARFEQGMVNPQSATDEDLTMHMVIASNRGIDLLGTFPVEQLPKIPRLQYLEAILEDFAWAQNQDEDLSGYLESNACRTLAFLREGLVLSKFEGRRWCQEHAIDTSNIVADVERALKHAIA